MSVKDKICAFEIPGLDKTCTALRQKDCEGCAFFKTREQNAADIVHAAEILKAKGLEPYMKGKIMTTRLIKEKSEYQQIKNKENEA